MTRSMVTRISRPAAAAAAVAAFAVTAIAGCGTAAGPGQPARTPAAGHSTVTSDPAYRYYRSMLGQYRGGMMGGGPGGWMMGAAGYRWMTGLNRTPGWMRGGRLPGWMMGGGTDMGAVMGRFWAGAPGPRVSPARAAALGDQVPAGARVSRAGRVITFTTGNVHLAAVASPAGGPDETFRIAGLVNPRLVVPLGARVSIEVINADPGTAHGMVITAAGAARSPMPMMTSRPAFAGAALWFLGNPTSAGLHAGTLTFTAATAGSYRYLCPVPDHARTGMTGAFIVR